MVGGYEFAHGEPGAKRALAGVAAGTGIAVLAAEADPAMLRIVARSEQFRSRYDAAKQEIASVEVR